MLLQRCCEPALLSSCLDWTVLVSTSLRVYVTIRCLCSPWCARIVLTTSAQRNMAGALKRNPSLAVTAITGVPLARFWREAGLPFPIHGADAGQTWRSRTLLRRPQSVRAHVLASRAFALMRQEAAGIMPDGTDVDGGTGGNRVLLATLAAYRLASLESSASGGGDGGGEGAVARGTGQGRSGDRQLSVPLMGMSPAPGALVGPTHYRSDRAVSYGAV